MRTPGSRFVNRATAVVVGVVLVSAWSASAVGAGVTGGPSPAVGTALLHSFHQAGSRPVTVIVELAGASVTAAAAATDNTLSTAGMQHVKAALQRQQAVVGAKITAVGGTVTASYQLVYNGLAVSIAGDRVASLAAVSGVKSVHRVRTFERDNTRDVPFVGAPQAWSGVAGSVPVHGEGMKIGIIDTGIDYTHADFGGPGTTAAYQAALASDTTAADPTLFGPGAPRVKGGTDLVGDGYNGSTAPAPDPNPLDCNGHGTHVAGTAAGSGVLGDGSTYTGPYDSSTIASHSWNVGPGAAPDADIYSIRVFGCAGGATSAVIMSALEWAADNGMDVVNLSLGSSYGSVGDPETNAVDNLTNAGTIVVASAGNSGQNPYLVGAPSSASGAISVAATDVELFSNIALSSGPSVTAIEANDVPPTNLGSLPVVVLSNGSGGISLGCNQSDYPPSVAGAVVVTLRGTCARVQRAIDGQRAGAAAVVMVNNAAGYPPYEAAITTDPASAQAYHVTIPFLGVQPGDAAALQAAAGGTAQFSDAAPTDALASFSSGGPRTGDNALKPDVAAPGVSVISAGMGTGNAAAILSGTSMASPLTAGVAALVRQAHPTWLKTRYWKAAIVNTAVADQVTNYRTRNAGAGLIQAPPAVTTSAVALGDRNTATLSYGFAELGKDYHNTHPVTVRNFAATPVTFTIATAHDAGSPHSILAPPTVTVPAHSAVKVAVELDVAAATAGSAATFNDVSGLVTFTPLAGTNNDVMLSVPYYFVEQAVSRIKTRVDANALESTGSAPATTTNTRGIVTGQADWYAWGLTKPASVSALPEIDIRAVGVQASASTISFAISTYGRWSNAAANEFDLDVDVDSDGTDDYVVISADQGLLQGLAANGIAATAVVSLSTSFGVFVGLTEAPFNSATMVLRVARSRFCANGSACLANQSGRIGYHLASFGRDGSVDTAVGPALFNTVSPAVSVGMFDTVAPGGSASETATYDATEAAITPPLGFLIVSHDNKSGSGHEAQLIALP